MLKTRLIIIGGFLGAGKTTLLASISQLLLQQGKKVGVITNDQAEGLVDTHVLLENGLTVKEIAGSCFCCDFDGLMEAALYLRDSKQCDFIIAEPVGSCTDLSATLMQPTKAYYLQYFDLAPLSVLCDPLRLKTILENINLTKDGSEYIYLKQLEEADYLLINKSDILSNDEKTTLEKLLNNRFSEYPIYWISALNKIGINQWFENLLVDKNVGSRIADVDYDIYAKGEALMGWYNATFLVGHLEGGLLPWEELNIKFIELLQQIFNHEQITIGHIKTFLKDNHSYLKGNITNENQKINLLGTPFRSRTSTLVLNIRVETSSVEIKEIVDEVIESYLEYNIKFKKLIVNHLTPGKPVPTHKMDLTLKHVNQ
jgi:Ni2+-binding GTPase involved in maturation of urease and hydrogenase